MYQRNVFCRDFKVSRDAPWTRSIALVIALTAWLLSLFSIGFNNTEFIKLSMVELNPRFYSFDRFAVRNVANFYNVGLHKVQMYNDAKEETLEDWSEDISKFTPSYLIKYESYGEVDPTNVFSVADEIVQGWPFIIKVIALAAFSLQQIFTLGALYGLGADDRRWQRMTLFLAVNLAIASIASAVVGPAVYIPFSEVMNQINNMPFPLAVYNIRMTAMLVCNALLNVANFGFSLYHALRRRRSVELRPRPHWLKVAKKLDEMGEGKIRYIEDEHEETKEEEEAVDDTICAPVPAQLRGSRRPMKQRKYYDPNGMHSAFNALDYADDPNFQYPKVGALEALNSLPSLKQQLEEMQNDTVEHTNDTETTKVSGF